MRKWRTEEKLAIEFDETKQHRLKLQCIWNDSEPTCLYVMLNPSTADLTECDRTVDRCISFAKAMGYGGMEIVNVYSYRTSSPQLLREAGYLTLSANNECVKEAMRNTDMIIIAYGNHAKKKDCEWIEDYAAALNKPLHCFGTTQTGAPKHLLYLRADTRLVEYSMV